MQFENEAERRFHNFVVGKVTEYVKDDDVKFSGDNILTPNDEVMHIGVLTYGHLTLSVILYLPTHKTPIYSPSMKILDASYDGIQCLSVTIDEINTIINQALIDKEDALYSKYKVDRLNKIEKLLSE